MKYKYLRVQQDKHGVLTVTLNRPEVRNAFDDEAIVELTYAFDNIAENVRVVVLKGVDPVFCSGGDLLWMVKAGQSSWDVNLGDAQRLVRMFNTIQQAAVPIIASVQGAAIGGGIGLLCLCDIVVSAENAIFQTSEIRLGLTPACIAPYVVEKIGLSHAQFLFLSGNVITAQRAQEMGLVHQIVEAKELDNMMEKIIDHMIHTDINVLRTTKELLRRFSPADNVLKEDTARILASLRSLPSTQENMIEFIGNNINNPRKRLI